MKGSSKIRRDLLTMASLGSVLAAVPVNAWSQQAGGNDVLGEVVVTATRQSTTVNRVAISMTAVTAETIEKQGLKDVQDLARSVPSLNFKRGGGEGNPSVSIRGIGSTLGSPTTGVYLDDVPIQKRDTNGAVTGNGSPFPMLYDLSRVEVLRGPQGTLYGGSAQGGAIRFITPTPSLTDVSASARAEVSSLSGGSTGYELGAAMGGPLIDDKVGVRASYFKRRQGGYLDHVSFYTGQEFAKDSNWREGEAGRVTFLVNVNDAIQLTPAEYFSHEYFNNNDVYYRDIPQITYAAGIFTNRGTTQSGVAYDFPDTVFAGGTFGPYNYYGKYKTFQGYYPTTTSAELRTSPRTGETLLPSLTLDLKLGGFATLKSVTSYLSDRTWGYTSGTSLGHRAQVLPTTTNSQFVRSGSVGTSCAGAATSSITDDGVCRASISGGVGTTVLFIPGFPQRQTALNYSFSRRAITQEMRLQSIPDSSRFDWLAGLFFTDVSYKQRLIEPGNEQQSSIFLRGVGEEWFMGTVNVDNNDIPLPVGVAGNHSYRDQTTKERELAAFGELSYRFTDELKATAGLRYSKTDVSYLQYTGASVFGNTLGFVGTPGAPTRITSPTTGHPFPNQPGDPYYNVVDGKQNEKPVSPKLGLAWQATPSDLLYATYSTGYRPGGVNQPAPPGNCAPTLAALGITSTPLDFKSDKVISYEVGAKNRILGMQINTSAFYIDWKNPQISQRLTQCGHTYIDNAGAAVSKGFDVQVSGRLAQLSLQAAVAYTDARYTETVLTTVPAGVTPQVLVYEGDSLGAPKWQLSLGAQYDFKLADRPAFVRADYQYATDYLRTTGPGTVSYQAVVYQGDAARNLNARVGVLFNSVEASVYASNLTDESTVLGVGNTSPSTIVTETAVRPREVGVTLSYRH